jgi:hypothetical protein
MTQCHEDWLNRHDENLPVQESDQMPITTTGFGAASDNIGPFSNSFTASFDQPFTYTPLTDMPELQVIGETASDDSAPNSTPPRALRFTPRRLRASRLPPIFKQTDRCHSC